MIVTLYEDNVAINVYDCDIYPRSQWGYDLVVLYFLIRIKTTHVMNIKFKSQPLIFENV